MTSIIRISKKICGYLFLVVFCSLLPGIAFSQLSGTKTINPTGGDYSSFTAAVNALVAQGVSGPVVFNVAAGTYTEQVIIPEITGANAANTITFQSPTGDSSLVVLSFNATLAASNYTLLLNGSDYIVLRKITIQALGASYGRVVEIAGSATSLIIENCRVIGFNSTGGYSEHSLVYSYRAPITKLNLRNNFFSGSNYGLYLEGVNSTTLTPETRISGNSFSNQRLYGMHLESQNAPVVSSNSIQLKSDAGHGIYMQYCDNALLVENNNIILPGGHYGIYQYLCDGNSLARGLVVNNTIAITGGGNASGIHYNGSTFQNVWHNSVQITAVTTSDYGAFYLTGGSNIDIRNNIFSNAGENYAYNIKTPTAIEFSDFNNYYSNGNFLAFWGSKREDIAQLKAGQSPLYDANSISFNPVFVSATNLHGGSFRIDNKGTNLGITKDMDGQTRTAFDIGADEFTGTGSALAAGTYTIGGASPTFSSFAEAAAVINTYGISGTVTFNVRNGTYNEQFVLSPVAGTGPSSQVVFQAEGGDSTKVELSFNSGNLNNYLVRFTGADYVTFRKLSFTALNPTYSRIFLLEGSSHNNTITSSILNGQPSGSTGDALVYSYESNVNNLSLTWNLFSAGRYGIYHNPNSLSKATGLIVRKNNFNSQRGSYPNSIYLRYHIAPDVQSNSFTNTLATNYYAINLQDCTDDIKVISNRVNSNNSEGGILLNACKSINTKRGLVANNFVAIGGSTNAWGIYLHNSEYQDVYHNSVRISSSHLGNGRAFYNSANSNNINLRNNNFSNFGDGYAIYSEGTTVNFASNYNNVYSTGIYPAFWNGTSHSSLASYQAAASPLDANSISVNPVYLSEVDLHAQSSFVNNAGIPLSEVLTDIDGQNRNPVTPDIGADEFIPTLLPLAAGTYTIGGEAPSYPDFSSAVSDLNSRGVSGPVVFNVRNGIYNEQISFYEINGASLVNNILFQSESGDSSKVELIFTATINNPQIVQLSGTDYISFRKLTFSALNPTYSMVFNLRGGIRKLSIQNCVLNSNGSTGAEYYTSIIYSGNATLTDLLVENSFLAGGRSGIWMESPPSAQSVGTRILNTRFIGQYYDGLYLKYHEAAKIERNNIVNTTSYVYFNGIFLSYCSNDITVNRNTVNLPAGRYGIFLQYCSGNISKTGLVSNNTVETGGTGGSIAILVENSNYQRVYFNSSKVTSTDVNGSSGFSVTAGSNIDVRNNSFANFGGGWAYTTNSVTAITGSDFNNLFTTGNFLANYNAPSRDLISFRSLSGKEANSISVNPVYTSLMRTTSSYLNNKGSAVAVVTTDIDGESRSIATPDIGADEFVPSQLPFAGTFTIGGTSPDFASFSAAASALNERGVSGPVTFNVRSGIYTDQLELMEISGASAINKIVFQSEEGDSTKVTLNYNSGSASSNFVVRLIGTDYLTLRNLTIAGTNPVNSNLITLVGNVSQVNILNNVLSSNINATSIAISSPDGNVLNTIAIKNNNFLSGSTGIFLDGNSTTQSQGLEIIGNKFNNQKSYGIRLDGFESPQVKENDLYSNNYGYEGIYLYNCNTKPNVSANKIFTENLSTGITFYYCYGTLVNQGVISNNFVSIAGNSSATGIHINSSQYLNVVYNSVSITTTYSTPAYKSAFYLSGGDNVFVRNNIFSCSNGGYAYNVNTPAAVDGSDFNNLYSTTDLAVWGGVRSNIAALRTANSMDAKSLSVNPEFASASDLQVKQALLHKAATPLAIVTTDIFGNLRDAIKPDIGATEFSCVTPVIDFFASSSCFGDSTEFSYNITKVAYGSNFSFDFDNDFNPDETFNAPNGSIKHLFATSGAKSVNLIVSQLAGCNNSLAKTISVEPSPVLDVITEGAYCGSDNGTAMVNVTAGSGPFSYHWSNGSNAASVGDLPKGSYSVTVKNIDNCISTATFEIADKIIVSASELSPSTCGQSDGSAVATATGGSGPYSFVWSNGESLATALKLTSGANYVTVTDGTGCSTVGSVNISTDASGPKIALKSITHNTCYGEKAGALDVTLTGGTIPYSIQWSNGELTEDLANLASGIYDILVTDNTGCLATATFGIEQPVFLNVSTVVEDASCSGSDGKAIALAGGGSKPYTYQWSNGNSGPVAQNLSAGIYTLTLTDNKSCSIVTPVIVNNSGGPKVSLNNLTGVNCNNEANGSIDIQISGGTPLYSYSWLPGGQTSQDITGLTEGSYEVSVTDDAGCIGVSSFVIGEEPPATNPICLVTVDSISGKNLVVWEKLNQSDAAFYNIYRESSSKGLFQLIATQPAEEISEYTDEVADPSLRSWRYKISVVDDCGNESELSESHKTIHLTQNVGLNGRVNLIWDKYEGFASSSYKILRYSKEEGWITLGRIPGDLTSFTDDRALLEKELYYEIEVENPNGGCSTLKASTHNTSRSNRQSTTVKNTTGISENESLKSLAIYPNPAKTEFTLELNRKGLHKLAVEMIDAKGQVLRNYQYPVSSDEFRTTIDISGISEGVYVLRISSDTQVSYRKLVIQP